MSWNTFVSRLPQGIRLQTDAERLLETDLPVIRKFEMRCALNPARSVEAQIFREKLEAEREYRRANVAQIKFNKIRRTVGV